MSVGLFVSKSSNCKKMLIVEPIGPNLFFGTFTENKKILDNM